MRPLTATTNTVVRFFHPLEVENFSRTGRHVVAITRDGIQLVYVNEWEPLGRQDELGSACDGEQEPFELACSLSAMRRRASPHGARRSAATNAARAAAEVQEVLRSQSVIVQLSVIGGLSKRLSERFKDGVPLPWKQIAGFRDRAVHDYFQLISSLCG